jgi:glycosyltransferase involved in cell wall biosynthesis/SAM-dependent methyltransferase
MRVCLFGTYDRVAHPRIAILAAALEAVGVEVVEAHAPRWSGGTSEKLQVASRPLRLRAIWRQAIAWGRLLRRYRQVGPHDVVLVGYFGHLDVHLARFLAGRRRVVLDMFLSVYDTVVLDRGMGAPDGPRARLTRLVDRAAVRACRLALLDTQAQIDFCTRVLGIPANKLAAVAVGAEPDRFPVTPLPDGGPLRVLFYGSFIPLHGTPTLAAAIRRLNGEPIEFTVVGRGQERAAFDRAAAGLPNVTVVDWTDYDRLGELVAAHQVVLGVFGDGDKASRVVANKVYQAACAGRAIVTADTPATRAAFAPDEVMLVPPADPEALAGALRQLAADRAWVGELGGRARKRFERDYDLAPLGRRLLTLLRPEPEADSKPAAAAGRDRKPATEPDGAGGWVPAPRFLLRLDLIRRLLPRLASDQPLLELGFGAGGILVEVADRGFREVIGVDSSASAVRDATRQLERVPPGDRPRLLRANLNALNPDRIQFGSILAFEVLEHIENDREALAQAYELLAPGGRMLVSVPAHQARFTAVDEAVGHYRRYERDQLVDRFVAAGFEVETLWSYGYPLANLLDWVRARFTKPPAGGALEARSAESCNMIPARRLVKLLVRPLTMAPFLLLQRLFVGTDRGDGYILLARKRPGPDGSARPAQDQGQAVVDLLEAR